MTKHVRGTGVSCSRKIPSRSGLAIPTMPFLARQRWLQRGFGVGLVAAIRSWTEPTDDRDRSRPNKVVDLGCGEGYFGRELFKAASYSYCGIDLSKRALRLAARSWPAATWALANADRGLPIFDRDVSQVISLFGRRPIAEISRVLQDRGTCIVAVPAEDDLIQLREQVQQAGHRRNRSQAIEKQFMEDGLSLVDRKRWSETVFLESDAIADALAMTYRGVRHSQHTIAARLDPMDVTLAADLMLFRR